MICIGGAMFLVGLVMFYSIELGQTEPTLRLIKNTGTFVGLSGIGVTVAGVLLYLINRNQPPIQENFECKE
ncbi:MAG: hypothetical protein J4F36_01120 [Nitrosopumilaceae archaeon]|nr:hypothetical protein [Nitrosopumilaceae archaeon]